MVDKKTDPNIAAYTNNLGAVVLGKDFAVQGHNYFNAMRNADIALMLTHNQLSGFKYEHGQVINLVSGGLGVKITPLEGWESFKHRIKEILNGSS